MISSCDEGTSCCWLKVNNSLRHTSAPTNDRDRFLLFFMSQRIVLLPVCPHVKPIRQKLATAFGRLRHMPCTSPNQLGSLQHFTRQRTRRRAKTNAWTKQSPSAANRSNILLENFRTKRPAIPRSKQFESASYEWLLVGRNIKQHLKTSSSGWFIKFKRRQVYERRKCFTFWSGCAN